MVDKSARDKRIARVAARQHGAVATSQLHDAGLTNAAIWKRCQAGRLHRLHRGVYAVGHLAPSIERTWMAAVLALQCNRPPAGPLDAAEREAAKPAGQRAERAVALSHRSAAALWRLLPPGEGLVDISVGGQGGRKRRQGIRIHRCNSLAPEHVTRRRGIPVTTPARTIADLRSLASPSELRRAIRQADVLGLPVGPDTESDGTRSELEFEFLRLCKRYSLPRPEVNVRVGPLLVDFLWQAQRYVVETDGYSFHRGRAAFEDDHARDLELRTRGYEVARFSYRQVIDEPAKVAQGIRTALAQRA